MRLIMVRHGEPNYVDDCLTETGKKQAEAAAERLMLEPIDEIYSSPNGRAHNTAEYTAKAQGLKNVSGNPAKCAWITPLNYYTREFFAVLRDWITQR